jgi:hypothetical protein
MPDVNKQVIEVYLNYIIVNAELTISIGSTHVTDS